MFSETLTTDFGALAGIGLNAVAPVVEEVPAVVVESAPLVDTNHFFDFEKAKVQSLTLDQLRRTVKENDGENGKPLHKIYHFELIDQARDIFREYGYETEIYDMFATNNRDKMTPGVSLYPKLEERFGERAVEAHSIRRLFCNIRLRDFDTDEVTTNLAVSYTQRGIQIGIGRNVKICHNQCMLSAENYIADFSARDIKGEKLSLDEMFKKLRFWAQNMRDIVNRDDEIIARMKQTKLTGAQVLLIIGMLTAIRVKADTNIDEIHKNMIYPLNQAQISRFTERLLLLEHKREELNLWALYNAATDLYKPQTNEQTRILTQNLALVEFFRNNQLLVN